MIAIIVIKTCALFVKLQIVYNACEVHLNIQIYIIVKDCLKASCLSITQVKQFRYRPGVAQRVPGS